MFRQMISPMLNGILTGMFLQLAIGPVFFLIFGITLESGIIAALYAVAGVTLADYLYIMLSLIGLGQILQNGKAKTIMSGFSPIVLILFGILILIKCAGTGPMENISVAGWTPIKSFIGALFFTLSNPLTILFWTGIFSAKAAEKKYEAGQLLWFGIGTGSATILFLLLCVLLFSTLKTQIPAAWILKLNALVGLALLVWGMKRTAVLGKTLLFQKEQA